jgi:Heme NO binding associated
MDHMLKMMEDYTNNLESLIEERTRELTDEKARIDHLLYNMLPA